MIHTSTAPGLTSTSAKPSSPSSKSTLARSFTRKLKRGLSLRASTIFESEKPFPKPVRPTISLPLERPDIDAATRLQAFHIREHSNCSWVALVPSPTSPTSSSSSMRQSVFSSPASSRASSSSRTSYGDDSYFSPLHIEKKVSFTDEITSIPRRGSTSSSLYAAEGELPPPIEEDEIMNKLGKFRFAAAEYIQEIEGTPMILVDGKLYL
jgi:hypothetical protein